jgi:hypothetical protein
MYGFTYIQSRSQKAVRFQCNKNWIHKLLALHQTFLWYQRKQETLGQSLICKNSTNICFTTTSMESMDLVKSIIRCGNYMISIDLNQAFYHISLAELQQSYFTFNFQTKQYCFICLSISLTASLRIFIKVLKLIIKMA